MTDAPDDEPKAPNQRSFSLNSPEAYEALCGRRERPWIPNGALPREPKWPRGDSSDGGAQLVRGTGEHCHVRAETDAQAMDALSEWMRHVDAGRIGGET